MSEISRATAEEAVTAVAAAGGSRVDAARALGITDRTLYKRLTAARDDYGMAIPPAPKPTTARTREILKMTEPAHSAAPEHFHVKGVSSYIGKDGKLRGQWVKTDQNAEERYEMLRAATEALCQEIKPQRRLPKPKGVNADLLSLYTITDYHVGMLAWREEGGADWDLKIAERTLIDCFRHLVNGAPPAKHAVVYQGGDFLHTDGFMPLTPTSKHVLDADSRFPKIVQVAVRALRAIANAALEKHAHVHVIMEEGNHDLASSVWLRALFAALYEKEPRVTVETSPLPYHAYQHGKTMLAFHHGHLTKPDKLPGLMAAQFSKMWGETQYRYGHMGHQHHRYVKEHSGMTVEQHRTLAARDAHASRGGWHADRDAQRIDYHAEFGEGGRGIVTPEMIS